MEKEGMTNNRKMVWYSVIWGIVVAIASVSIATMITLTSLDSNATELEKVQECLTSGKQWVYVDNTVDNYECVSSE